MSSQSAKKAPVKKAITKDMVAQNQLPQLHHSRLA